MTTGELIAKLFAFRPDVRVVIISKDGVPCDIGICNEMKTVLYEEPVLALFAATVDLNTTNQTTS